MGAIKTATIQSGIEPVLPGAPTRLAVSNIEAFSVVLQFTPGFDGNSSVTKWTVQVATARPCYNDMLAVLTSARLSDAHSRLNHHETARGIHFTK